MISSIFCLLLSNFLPKHYFLIALILSILFTNIDLLTNYQKILKPFNYQLLRLSKIKHLTPFYFSVHWLINHFNNSYLLIPLFIINMKFTIILTFLIVIWLETLTYLLFYIRIIHAKKRKLLPKSINYFIKIIFIIIITNYLSHSILLIIKKLHHQYFFHNTNNSNMLNLTFNFLTKQIPNYQFLNFKVTNINWNYLLIINILINFILILVIMKLKNNITFKKQYAYYSKKISRNFLINKDNYLIKQDPINQKLNFYPLILNYDSLVLLTIWYNLSKLCHNIAIINTFSSFIIIVISLNLSNQIITLFPKVFQFETDLKMKTYYQTSCYNPLALFKSKRLFINKISNLSLIIFLITFALLQLLTKQLSWYFGIVIMLGYLFNYLGCILNLVFFPYLFILMKDQIFNIDDYETYVLKISISGSTKLKQGYILPIALGLLINLILPVINNYQTFLIIYFIYIFLLTSLYYFLIKKQLFKKYYAKNFNLH